MATKEQDFIESSVLSARESLYKKAGKLLLDFRVDNKKNDVYHLETDLPMQHELPNRPGAIPEYFQPSRLLVYGGPHIIARGLIPSVDPYVDLVTTKFTPPSQEGNSTSDIDSFRMQLLKVGNGAWTIVREQLQGELIEGSDSTMYIPTFDNGHRRTQEVTSLEQLGWIEVFQEDVLNALKMYLEQNKVPTFRKREFIQQH